MIKLTNTLTMQTTDRGWKPHHSHFFSLKDVRQRSYAGGGVPLDFGTIGILKDVKKDTAVISSIKEDTTEMRGSLKSLEEIHKETLELRHKYDKLEKDVELIKTKLSIP